MPRCTGYRVHVLRSDNDMDELVIPTVKGKDPKLVNIVHRGHRYHFDPEFSFRIHEPMKFWQYITPARLEKYERLMLFREPEVRQQGVMPIEPLRVPDSPPYVEESPLVFKGITRSGLLARYRAKQRFGFRLGTGDWKWIVILGIVVVFGLMLLTGKINLGG